jgi:hypothetical protein
MQGGLDRNGGCDPPSQREALPDEIRNNKLERTMTTVSVNPDDFHILSATATEAVLKGSVDNEVSHTDTPCVLIVKRAVYFAALTAWLDGKTDYASRTGGSFCGVGRIYFEAKLKKKSSHHLRVHAIDAAEDDDGQMVGCDSYSANTFDVDMEHG